MLTDARQKYITDTAFKEGEVIISDIAQRLDISTETIRRDINTLAKMGLLEKVHGGAVPIYLSGQADGENKSNDGLKRKLGTFIGRVLTDASTVFLTKGTSDKTIENFGKRAKPVSVITNSLSVAEAIGKLTDGDGKTSVFIIGGKLNTKERYTYGAEVISDIKKYHADVCIINADGIDENGAMCSSVDEGAVISQMIANSSSVILTADSSAFGKKSAYLHCPIASVDRIITDGYNQIPQKIINKIKKENIKLNII